MTRLEILAMQADLRKPPMLYSYKVKWAVAMYWEINGSPIVSGGSRVTWYAGPISNMSDRGRKPV